MSLSTVTPRPMPSGGRRASATGADEENPQFAPIAILRCEFLEDRCLLSGPDVRVTQLDWNILRDYARSGDAWVDLSYRSPVRTSRRVRGRVLLGRGPSRRRRAGRADRGAQPRWAQGSHQLNDPALWDRPPLWATHLLVVADPDNAIAESDETNNVARFGSLGGGTPRRALAVGSAGRVHGAGGIPARGRALHDLRAEVVLGVHHFNWINQVDVPGAMEVRQRSASGYTFSRAADVRAGHTVGTLGSWCSTRRWPARDRAVCRRGGRRRPLYWNEPGWWYARWEAWTCGARGQPARGVSRFAADSGRFLRRAWRSPGVLHAAVGRSPDGSAIALAEVPGSRGRRTPSTPIGTSTRGVLHFRRRERSAEPIFGGCTRGLVRRGLADRPGRFCPRGDGRAGPAIDVLPTTATRPTGCWRSPRSARPPSARPRWTTAARRTIRATTASCTRRFRATSGPTR